MPVHDKRGKVAHYCTNTDCSKCHLDVGGWVTPLTPGLNEGIGCLSIGTCGEKDLDRALELIKTPKRIGDENPYWDNITKIAEKQRDKGMKTYCQGLEYNNKPTVERIQYIEEELVDALMYLEWLKEKIKDGR